MLANPLIIISFPFRFQNRRMKLKKELRAVKEINEQVMATKPNYIICIPNCRLLPLVTWRVCPQPESFPCCAWMQPSFLACANHERVCKISRSRFAYRHNTTMNFYFLWSHNFVTSSLSSSLLSKPQVIIVPHSRVFRLFHNLWLCWFSFPSCFFSFSVIFYENK